jgi:hypothetical protein
MIESTGVKYTSATLGVISLAITAYLAYATFMQKKPLQVPLYVSIGLTILFFAVSLMVRKTPIEYTRPEKGFGADAMNDFLSRRSSTLSSSQE